jgi:hypothetical protein
MSRVALALVVIATMTGCSGGDQKPSLHSTVEVERVFAGNGLELRKRWGGEGGGSTVYAVEGADIVDVQVFHTEEEARSVYTSLDYSKKIAPNDLLLRSSNVIVASVAAGRKIDDDTVRNKLKAAISQLNG